jgi:serine O-acetyltransferase
MPIVAPNHDRWLDHVCAARSAYRLPVRADALATEFVADALALLFPHFASGRHCDRSAVAAELERLRTRVTTFLLAAGRHEPDARAIADAFVGDLPGIHDALLLDAAATHEADPAATSTDEVVLAYPGFYALSCYRFAHQLLSLGVPLLPRLVTETAHRVTGIDIHPAARLGRSIAIDHGTGIVIGETSDVGDGVRLYQGVTLGALSVHKELSHTKRHPTIEHDVVIYANATILGGDTVVGHSSVIGGNVWLTHSVPPHSVVTHAGVTERLTPETQPPIDVKL